MECRWMRWGFNRIFMRRGRREFSKGWKELRDGAKELGLQVFITEMDVNDDKLDTSDVTQLDQQVATVYRNYLTTALEGPEVKAVLTWGASDRNTWLNNTTRAHKMHPDRRERPLPFDENYEPTAAFFAMRECFRQRQETVGSVKERPAGVAGLIMRKKNQRAMVLKSPEEATGEDRCGREGEDPGEGDIADGGHLQAALVGPPSFRRCRSSGREWC